MCSRFWMELWKRILMLLLSQRLWKKMIEVMVRVMILRQFQRSTRAIGCCHLSCTRRLQFSPKCTKIVGAYSAPTDPLAALDYDREYFSTVVPLS